MNLVRSTTASNYSRLMRIFSLENEEENLWDGGNEKFSVTCIRGVEAGYVDTF